MANAFARYVAGKFVQFERQRQTLFTSHLLVTPDLLLQCVLGFHSLVDQSLFEVAGVTPIELRWIGGALQNVRVEHVLACHP